MIVCPNSKINIGLRISGKRADGFHNLSGFFIPVDFKDILEIVPSEHKTNLKISGLKINADTEDNLVLKAYKYLKSDFDLPEVRIHLHKQIPFEAGLGGGSSDAAHTIILLNKLFDLNLDNQKMKTYAAKLGSDCSFFIENKAAYLNGIGHELSICDNFVAGKHIKIFKPDFGVSTSEAYSGVNISGEFIDMKSIKGVSNGDFQNIFVNDFERHLFKKYPELQNIKNEILKSGAFYASLTGSGSAVFGLYDSVEDTPESIKKYLIYQGNL